MRTWIWLGVLALPLAAGAMGGSWQRGRTVLRSGSEVTGTAWSVRATIGEPIATEVTGGSWALRGGLWAPPGTSPTDAPALAEAAPDRFFLGKARPNPARGSTEIVFGVPGAGGRVQLRLYDVHGRLVRRLTDGAMAAGHHAVRWDARDESGSRVAAGVYFAVLDTPEGRMKRKLLMLR